MANSVAAEQPGSHLRKQHSAFCHDLEVLLMFGLPMHGRACYNSLDLVLINTRATISAQQAACLSSGTCL